MPAPCFLLARENTLMLQYNAGNSNSYLDTNVAGKMTSIVSLELLLKLVLMDAGKESKQTETKKYIST